MVKENYNYVKQQVEETAKACGRDSKEITLIAVSKTKPLENIEELIEIGVEDFGENKVQELCDKYEHVSQPVRFHLIGHLQTNKVKYIVAEEDSKFGLHTEDVIPFIQEISTMPNLHVNGLMTIAPFVDDPEDNRKYFRTLKQLSLDITSKNIDNIDMNVLSMGMTNDYKVAIEEGATMVRVGTAIFGARNYNI
mgnify:CR=1 FL=1